MTNPGQPWSPPGGPPSGYSQQSGPPYQSDPNQRGSAQPGAPYGGPEQGRPPTSQAPPPRPAGPGGEQQFQTYREPGATAVSRDEDLGQPLSSVGDIIGQITQDLSTLVRQEADLAKAEIKQSAKRAGKGTGMFGGAGVAAHMGLLFLTIAAWWGIAHLISSFGWAALIVAVLWLIIAAVLAVLGRKEFQQIDGVPKTVDTVQQIPDALKGNEDIR